MRLALVLLAMLLQFVGGLLASVGGKLLYASMSIHTRLTGGER